MKIGPMADTAPPIGASTERAASSDPPKTGSAAAPRPAAPPASAHVALSPEAHSLRAEADGATFDTAKVHRIAQAISEGKFQINAEAIADKLIANATEMLQRRGSR